MKRYLFAVMCEAVHNVHTTGMRTSKSKGNYALYFIVLNINRMELTLGHTGT